jgi:transposase-like protein
MTISEIYKKFNSKQKCVEYMEQLRWPSGAICPKCGSKNVVKLKREIGRYHCNQKSCKTTFSILTDTIFEKTHLSLTKWFEIISLMLSAKRGISAKQIKRTVGMTYKTAWYACMRVRCGMIDFDHMELENIVEMDEAYIGGKPRHHYKTKENEPNLSKVETKRGRGTKKTPIVGIVERNGEVVVKVVEKLTSRNLLTMLKENVKTDKAIVVTDEFKSYKSFDDVVQHYTIDHSKKEYVKGMLHTNTIEGFWSIVKNSIRGNYIALSKKYLPFYLVQAQYIYNNRNNSGDLFARYLKEALIHDNPMENYKPIKPVKEIVYKKNN